MVLCAWICLGALIFLLRSTPGVAAMLCLPSALLAYMYTPQLFRLVRCPRCHGRLGELAYVAIMVSTHQVFVAAKQTLATDCSGSMTPIRSQRQFERRRHRRRQTPARPPSASRPYTSVCSAISRASSTSTPRYRTVLSSFVCFEATKSALVLTRPDDKSPNDIRQGEPDEGTAGSAVWRCRVYWALSSATAQGSPGTNGGR